MEPNAKLTILSPDGTEAAEAPVWILAGDHISAAKEHPIPEDGKAAWLDLSAARSAHIAYRAAKRHGLIADDIDEQTFIDTRLIEVDQSVSDDKAKQADPAPLENQTPDTSSK